jgi:hypothetical protein
MFRKKEKIVEFQHVKMWLEMNINSFTQMIETNKESMQQYKEQDTNVSKSMYQWCSGREEGYQQALKSFKQIVESLERLSYEK